MFLHLVAKSAWFGLREIDLCKWQRRRGGGRSQTATAALGCPLPSSLVGVAVHTPKALAARLKSAPQTGTACSTSYNKLRWRGRHGGGGVSGWSRYNRSPVEQRALASAVTKGQRSRSRNLPPAAGVPSGTPFSRVLSPQRWVVAPTPVALLFIIRNTMTRPPIHRAREAGMLSAAFGSNDMTASSKMIVLLTQETIGKHPDIPLLSDTFRNAGCPVRVLMLVSDEDGLELAQQLSNAEIDVELLLASDVADPHPGLNFARMPPQSKPADRDEFGLALSDVILADPANAGYPLARRAAALGKPVIAPGTGLPAFPQSGSVTHELDPTTLSRHKWRQHFAGRLEQAFLEVLALRLFRGGDGKLSDRLKQLRRCFRTDGKWCPSSYFSPEDCANLVPDPETFDPRSPLVTRFDVLDRSALFGSYIHRDLAWAAHLGAAFAVLAAVAGAVVAPRHPYAVVALAITELIMLLFVALIVFFPRRGRLQDRWTACRLGAEQLRIARMCLPLLVLQRALISEDKWPGRQRRAADARGLNYEAISEVKRAIRDHGLPRVDGNGSPLQAARWVNCIVADQILYHVTNHKKLERVETSLRTSATLLFFAAMLAVLGELGPYAGACLPHLEWLLLLTAAGPAFAAACHGVATRLAIVHRIALSEDVERELQTVHAALTEIIHRPRLGNEAWMEVRWLAFSAAEAMGRENRSWHSLVRLQPEVLPA
jgi:hypothetical protein